MFENLLLGVKAISDPGVQLMTLLGVLAGILGTILFPPFGGLIAAPLVLFILEYIRQRDLKRAFATLRGLAIGWGSAFVVRFLIGAAMIGVWLVWAINR